MNNSMKFPTFAFRISRDTYDRKPTGEEVASEIKKQTVAGCIETKKLDILCNYIERLICYSFINYKTKSVFFLLLRM